MVSHLLEPREEKGKPLSCSPETREAARRTFGMLAWELQLNSIDTDQHILNLVFPLVCARMPGLLCWSYCKLLPWQSL